MVRWLAAAFVLGLTAGIAGSTVAAGGPQAQESGEGVNVPGMPTLARIFVLNEGAAEAVPVVLHRGGDLQPVEIVGEPTVRLAPGPVSMSSTRQQWEYRELAVAGGEDRTALLNAAGEEGWEAVGGVGTGAASAILLKRPR